VKTILVTGGAGFIGSHLCKRLLEEGNKVKCLDFFLSSSADNIRPLLNHPNFTFLYRDVEFCNDLYFSGLDQIYNLACPSLPVHFNLDPIKVTKTAVIGTINMLELARKTGATLLQASTSEVYGDPLVCPQNESYSGNVNPLGKRSCYDEGKRCAESLCVNYHQQFGVKVKIARIFNTYGPHMIANEGGVVSNFVVQAIKGEPITIHGDGSQTRSFMYVDDLIEGMIRMMNETSDDCIGPWNLGNPNEITIMELAKEIIRLTDSKSEVITLPRPADDPTRRCPDISKAKAELNNWEPVIKLEEGLGETINYYKSLIAPTYGETSNK